MAFQCGIVAPTSAIHHFQRLDGGGSGRRRTTLFAPSSRTSASSPCRTIASIRSRRSSNRKKILPTSVEFVDIAGLVKGASKGEGLGNQFLGHIRSVDAVAHVVRCFDDPDVVHVHGGVDPCATSRSSTRSWP
jgi:hypothetical protein